MQIRPPLGRDGGSATGESVVSIAKLSINISSFACAATIVGRYTRNYCVSYIETRGQ